MLDRDLPGGNTKLLGYFFGKILRPRTGKNLSLMLHNVDGKIWGEDTGMHAIVKAQKSAPKRGIHNPFRTQKGQPRQSPGPAFE